MENTVAEQTVKAKSIDERIADLEATQEQLKMLFYQVKGKLDLLKEMKKENGENNQ